MRFALVLMFVGCSASKMASVAPPDSGSAPSGDAGEQQPDPAPGDGVADPSSTTLHDHGCAGVDWALIAGWLEIAHHAPDVGTADEPAEIERCVSRYAGWATHAADDAQVSRAMIYAGLAATGQCAADHDYDGNVVSGAQCAQVHAGTAADACLAQMQSSHAFGIATLAAVLAAAGQDPPLVAARLATGSATCGGSDHWKLVAPAGFVDHFVAAYNAYIARGQAVPNCKKRIIVTIAQYTGIGDAAAGANGCWTYERVSKDNTEWKICQYNGTVYHPSGAKWAYDDTNTFNDLTTETNRITACRSGTPVAGYIYMANRGSGWREVTSTGVRSHFAELYSRQTAIDDQFSLWKNGGEPGAPMVNFGEPSTSASQISASTARACAEVPDQDWFGVYVYPQTLDGSRLTAMVNALNACTKQ